MSTTDTTTEPVVDQVAKDSYDLFVPESTRENYRQIARDIAKAEGSTPEQGLAKLAAGFDTQHESDPLGGYNYLAAWARDEGDPGDGIVDTSSDDLARAVESAKREPRLALEGSPEAVAAAEETLARRDDAATADLVGVVPNLSVAEGVDLPSSTDLAAEADASTGSASDASTSDVSAPVEPTPEAPSTTTEQQPEGDDAVRVPPTAPPA